MDEITLEAHNAEAISRSHDRYLTPPDHSVEPNEMNPEIPESTITASQAKTWADKMWGHGTVSLSHREGMVICRVGYIGTDGLADFPGEGKTWDEAMTRAGADPDELEEIRRNGQG